MFRPLRRDPFRAPLTAGRRGPRKLRRSCGKPSRSAWRGRLSGGAPRHGPWWPPRRPRRCASGWWSRQGTTDWRSPARWATTKGWRGTWKERCRRTAPVPRCGSDGPSEALTGAGLWLHREPFRRRGRRRRLLPAPGG